MSHRLLRLAPICLLAVALAAIVAFIPAAAHTVAGAARTAAAGASGPQDGQLTSADLHLIPPGNSPFRASGFQTTQTVPYWSSSFTTDGVTYPFSMLGSDPASDTSTTIPTVLVPLKFIFSPLSSFDGGTYNTVRDPYTVDPDFGVNAVQGIVDSPIFQTAEYPDGVGNTQFGDAVLRAAFDQTGSSGYHVLLSTPTILPEVTITVPQNQAQLHAISGRIEFAWLTDRLKELLNNLHLDPHTLVIFTAFNILLYVHNPANCCAFGYHSTQTANSPNLNGNQKGNGNQPVQTYIFAPWFTSNEFAPAFQGDGDVLTMSHEVSESLNDPFVFNITPLWTFVGLTPPTCGGNLLENGDPLENLANDAYSYAVPINGLTFHVQDVVLLPWFEHQSPSTAVAGAYSFPDTTVAPTYAQSC